MIPNSFSTKEIQSLASAIIVEEQDLESDGNAYIALFIVCGGRIIDERLLTDKNRIIESIQRLSSKYPSAKWLSRLSDERIRHLAYDHAVLCSNSIRILNVLV